MQNILNMENKLKEQLRFKMLGQLSDERTREDIDNAYDIAVDFCLSFISFLRKNYHTEFETWTKDVLPLDKVQNKKTYDIINIEDVLNKFLQEYEQ